MKTNLRGSGDFKRVYQKGRRYDGLLMTAFILANDQPHHRLGLTASRKMSVRAVERNRAKRLLRETFRLHADTLTGLKGKYDWVLNTRRSLLTVSIQEPFEEFRRIVNRVERDEKSI